MTQLQSIQLFEERNVRTVWDDEQEKWYFSVVDVVQVLMGSDYQAARKYWKVLKGRIVQEAGQPVTTCYQFKMRAASFTPTDVLGLTQTAQKTQKRTCFARACHPDGYIRAIAPTRNERRLRRREL